MCMILALPHSQLAHLDPSRVPLMSGVRGQKYGTRSNLASPSGASTADIPTQGGAPLSARGSRSL